ncbi:caspase-1-like [Anopheles maculipalpis]|uniref:caspase-1-like n=1 Tax=Anopheles maculipalpis TaxID=1496333 RepID=UPI002158F062|nr:caspase-1-like [Anopheles maculipalpis]
MNVCTPKYEADNVDNNGRIVAQNSSVSDIISSSVVHNIVLVDDAHYDMRHEQRGVAVIFNHKHFFHLNKRHGTETDCSNIRQVLSDLQFEVRVYDDLMRNELIQVLDDLAGEDHKNRDCLLVVIMTHGEDDMLNAKDRTFRVDRLWENFIGKACPSLLGKPKLFFIQACRGNSYDTGVCLDHAVKQTAKTVSTTSARELHQPSIQPGRSKSIQYAIPSMADLLVMYSTYKGHYSWRNSTRGSWFIQALCDELRMHGNSKELLQLLTTVSRKVAYEFESHVPQNNVMNSKKQMPCIVSMLTKLVYFPRK